MADIIQWKRGSTAENNAYTALPREITVDSTLHTVRVHDGTTAGGTALASLSSVPTKLSQLTDDVGVWKRSELTKLSQLTNDKGFWLKSSLTKVSQLANDKGYLTAHCTHCTYCTYCTQCSNCRDCTTINCTTVNCSVYSYCDYCKNCNCDCNCSDDN